MKTPLYVGVQDLPCPECGDWNIRITRTYVSKVHGEVMDFLCEDDGYHESASLDGPPEPYKTETTWLNCNKCGFQWGEPDLEELLEKEMDKLKKERREKSRARTAVQKIKSG